MKAKDLEGKPFLKLVAGESGLENEIKSVYVGDLLSWVMGRAKEGSAWVTILGHVNIIAVAMLTNAACIIIAEGAEADAATIQRANNEDIPLFLTELTAFEVCKELIKCLEV